MVPGWREGLQRASSGCSPGDKSCASGQTLDRFGGVSLVSSGLFWAHGCCFRFPRNKTLGSSGSGILNPRCLLASPGDLVKIHPCPSSAIRDSDSVRWEIQALVFFSKKLPGDSKVQPG